MKRKLILCLFLILSNLSFSQTIKTQTIRGTIVDSESDYPLPGAAILLLTDSSTTPIGTVTDIDGRFTLKDIPLGRQNFVCKYIGYKDQMINNFLVIKGKEGVINIRLEERAFSLDEIVIASRQKGEIINDMVTASASALEIDEIVRFSGTLGDVSRMAQNFAGVSGASDDRNDIIVRGNSPSTVLWRMEGIDIPSPNHWATLGTTGGPISMLNTNSLKTSDFLSGAFPAEYGNVTGAVMDLRLKNGNSEKLEFLGQVGFNGFELGVEAPIKFIGNNASVIVNYRYSAIGLLNDFGLNFGTGSAVPEYQDVNFKLNIPTEKMGIFSIWGLGGISDISFLADDKSDNLYGVNNENLNSGSTTGILGANHKYFFNDRTSSTISIALSKSKNRETSEKTNPSNPSQFQGISDRNSEQQKTTINWTIKSKINKKNLVKVGANLELFNIKILDSVLVDNNFWFKESDFEGKTSLFRVFGQWQYKFNKNLKLNSGISGLYLGLNKSLSIEPRLGLSYRINDKNNIAVAYGRHSQMQPLPIYFSIDRNATTEQNALNKELDFIKSDHYVFSYTHHFTNKLKLKSELYYQNLSSIAVDPNEGHFSALNFGANFSFPKNTGLLNNGTGKNYGMEFTLQKNLHKGLYFLLTSSIFQSKYKGFDKIERNTYYNSNYVVNGLIGKEFEINKNLYLTIDSKFTYAGGKKYTPIDLEDSINNNEQIVDNSRIFESQYAPYIRPDLKIGIKANTKKTTHTWSIDLQNFIGRKNVFTQIYNEQSQSVKTLYQRGFFPDIRYQIVF